MSPYDFGMQLALDAMGLTKTAVPKVGPGVIDDIISATRKKFPQMAGRAAHNPNAAPAGLQRSHVEAAIDKALGRRGGGQFTREDLTDELMRHIPADIGSGSSSPASKGLHPAAILGPLAALGIGAGAYGLGRSHEQKKRRF